MAVRARERTQFEERDLRFDWIDRPRGTLGQDELHALVVRLRHVPTGARWILLDWRAVTHLDFRGIEPLVSRLRSLRDAGMEVRFAGVDSYMRALLRFSLAEEEFEWITGCVGVEGPAPAGAVQV